MKIKKITIISALSVFMLFGRVMNISAASVSPGGSFSASLYCGAYEGSIYVTGSNATITSGASWCDRGVTVSASATAGSSGSSSIYFYSDDLVNTDTGTEVGRNTYLDGTTVSIITDNGGNTGGGNNSGGGNSGGGNNSGGGSSSGGSGNSGGGSDSGSDSGSDNSEKTPEEIAAEEKEKAQKTPLVTSIDVTSMSSKLQGELIQSIPTAEDTWEYAYALPKRVEKYMLDVKAVDDGVTLTYDKEHEFKEGDSEVKEIDLRAVKGEIIQTYKIKISKDNSKPIEIAVNDKKSTVFVDEILDKFMSEAGFTREVFKNTDEVDVPYYALGKTKLQVLVDESNKAVWYTLDEKNAIDNPVTLMFDIENKPLLISDAPKEIQSETLEGKAYTSKVLPAAEALSIIDPEINWEQNYKAWDYTETEELIYGKRIDEENMLYHLNTEKSLNHVIVSFDKEGTSNDLYKWWAFGATAVSIVVSGMFARYIFVKRKEDKVSR